jgi:hypothetical protein
MNDSKRRIMGTDIDWTGIWETNYGKVELQQTRNIAPRSYKYGSVLQVLQRKVAEACAFK